MPASGRDSDYQLKHFDFRLARVLNDTHESPSVDVLDYYHAALPYDPSFDPVVTGQDEIELRFHHQPDDRHRKNFTTYIQYWDNDVPSLLRGYSHRAISFGLTSLEQDVLGAHIRLYLDWSETLQAGPAATGMEIHAKRVNLSSPFVVQLSHFTPSVHTVKLYLWEAPDLALGYEYELTLVTKNEHGTRRSMNTELIKLGRDPTPVQDLAYVTNDIKNDTHASVVITWVMPADTGEYTFLRLFAAISQ
ncbi:MAG: hypothetical protein MHM6MM_001544 [Cercozoa sp. M6MM]